MIVWMIDQIVGVFNTVSHRPLDNSVNIPISLVASVKYLPFIILWCFEGLCLPLFIGSWMLGSTFCLNARKKCFGNHCCPCHSVSLTCSSGWETQTFSHTHTLLLYIPKKFLRVDLDQALQWTSIYNICSKFLSQHFLSFPNSHFHLFIILWSATTKVLTSLAQTLGCLVQKFPVK